MASKEKAAQAKLPKRILFIHPDLGIGGAERLVVDAAVGLQDRGHSVTIYTSHCDPRHCFDEARNGIYRPRSDPGRAPSCPECLQLCADGRLVLRQSKDHC